MMKLLVWCVMFTEILAQLNLGDPCGRNNTGRCITVSSCPSSAETPKCHNLERCGWKGLTELVCCMEPALRKSEIACMQYKTIEILDLYYLISELDARPGEFPHIVALGNNDTGVINWGCAGSLISEKYILTAGHCVSHLDSDPPVLVRLGKAGLFMYEGGKVEEDIPVSRTIKHPKYYSGNRNNIALIELSKPVQFSSKVYPICLYTQPDTPTDLVVTGWAISEKREAVNQLLQYPASPVNLDECNKTYSSSAWKLSDSELCAVRKEALPGGQCEVSSASPIQVVNTNGKYGTNYILVGLSIVRLQDCERENSPSIYTRVSSYLDWIESIVWPDNDK